MNRQPRSVGLGRNLIALLALLVFSGPAMAQEDFVAPSYTLQYEGQNTEPWIWIISGGTGVAGVYGELKTWAGDGSGEQIIEWDLVMLAGPALQGRPHEIDDDWWTLVPALADPPAAIDGGDFVPTDMGPTAYDSIRWELIRGHDDRVVDGRNAEHWILTVNSWLRQQAGDDVIPMESSSHADLWFDPTLPFSAVPFAVARGGGFPLGVIDPPASQLVRERALPELRELGLLMRAEFTDRQLRHVEGLDGPMTLGPQETVLSVADVQPDGLRPAPLADAEHAVLTNYARLDADRAEALELSQYLTSACRVAVPPKEGSRAEGSVAGIPVDWAGAGFASEAEESLRVAAVSPPQDRTKQVCLVAVAAGDAGAGRYAATSPVRSRMRADGPQAESAWVMAAGGDAEARSRWMLVPESGALTLDGVTAGVISGSFAVTGWMIEVPEGGPATLTENAEVDISFVALPAD